VLRELTPHLGATGGRQRAWSIRAGEPSAARILIRIRGTEERMIIIGVVLLLLGFVLAIHILWVLGILALVIGLILLAMGQFGRPVGGRRHYW
jgi:Family of unknown function (DUF6131)